MAFFFLASCVLEGTEIHVSTLSYICSFFFIGELVVVDDEGELVIPGIDALEDTDPDAAAAVREWIMNQELGTCELVSQYTSTVTSLLCLYVTGNPTLGNK